MAGRELQIRLFRDALSTPWGFRLTGGKDLHASLVVQRVAVGSPVDGELHRGDIILEIQNQNATQMTHRQAQDAIRNAGGSLVLRVKRPYGQQHADPHVPLPPPVAYDYQPPHRGFMLGRLQETLSNVIAYPNNLYDYGDYNSTPSLSPSAAVPYPTWTRSAPRQRPPTITDLMEPGWTPQCLLNQQRQGRRPQTAAAPAPPRNLSATRAGGPSPAFGYVEQPESPAWLGSLRPSVDSKPSDQRVAGFQPSYADGHQQHANSNQSGGPTVIALPEGAQHLQYNSPLGLYNRSSVQQAIAGQFPGVNGAPAAANGTTKGSDSEVYRLVHETDRQVHRREASAAAKTSAHLNLPQGASGDSIRQSPSIRLLESQLLHGNDAEVGITDF